MPRVALHTLGCKLNYAETSSLGRQFLQHGYDIVEFGTPADVHVINTCSVTARADQECRQVIRRALRTSPESFVIVTGCYAQLQPGTLAAIDGVDLVLGSSEKFSLFELAGDMRKLSCARVHVADVAGSPPFGPAYTTEAGGRTRAFLKVQDGCDYSCSFCTIPRARGASRSQPLDECLTQAQALASEGFKEIVLTGVNVGDYGRKFSLHLLDLLEGLAAVPGLDRIRISSIEPNLLTREVLDLISGNSLFCRHFHIPLQSGSDRILRLMRRRYDTGDYRRLIEQIRLKLPQAGIGVDVIVGFPGETEDNFLETHAFLRDLAVSYLHVFTYSERPGTPAVALEGSVPPEERSRRNSILRTLSEKKRQAFLEGLSGNSVPVLLENEIDEGLRYGLTDSYARVGVPADGTAENTMVRVRVTDVRPGYCVGRLEGDL
ncbi:MAG TPA: tRNA (N(6)-L-threonylcarbamoyladenosine(37)-C(2))-methylthiotransferase MtaB [Bacteroidota bacterium]